jgi:hypothetical protein
MAGLGRKVFTAGDVLTASDMQSYVMDQTVMYFAGTAARSSAIATPTTGMTTYIGTTGTATIPQIESYTGASWQSLNGLTQLANVTVSAAATISLNNVFTTTYDSYIVEWTAIASTGTDIVGRLRASGTDLSTTYFTSGYLYSTAGAISGYGAGVTDRIYLAQFGSGGYSSGSIKFMNPALARYTNFIHDSTSTSQPIYHGGGSVQNTTTYDGFTLFTNGTGTMTGSIRVYGLRNS